MRSEYYFNLTTSKPGCRQRFPLLFRLNTLLYSGVLFFTLVGSSLRADIREIRLFDGSGLFRAQGVINEPVVSPSVKGTLEASAENNPNEMELASRPLIAGATVEVLLDKMPADALRLSPLDSISDPLSPHMVGERGGKLIFHFYGVQNGSWEVNVPSEALLEFRVLMGSQGHLR